MLFPPCLLLLDIVKQSDNVPQTARQLISIEFPKCLPAQEEWGSSLLLHLYIAKRQTQHQDFELLRLRRESKQHGKDIVNALLQRFVSNCSISITSHFRRQEVVPDQCQL
jgi:hypothetical protein